MGLSYPTSIDDKPQWASSPGRREVLQIQDRSHVYAMVTSVVLHGAVAAAIVYQIANSTGLPAPFHQKLVTMTVHLVPTDPIAQTATPSRAAKPEPSPELAALQLGGSSRLLRATAIRAPLNPGAWGGIPGSAAAPPASSAVAHIDGVAQSNYEETLRAYLRRYFVYPDAARADRLSGTVSLHLVVARNGQVLSAWVQQSSGHEVLDASALDLVHRAQPLPALPADLPDSQEIALPLEYAAPKVLLGAG